MNWSTRYDSVWSSVCGYAQLLLFHLNSSPPNLVLQRISNEITVTDQSKHLDGLISIVRNGGGNWNLGLDDNLYKSQKTVISTNTPTFQTITTHISLAIHLESFRICISMTHRSPRRTLKYEIPFYHRAWSLQLPKLEGWKVRWIIPKGCIPSKCLNSLPRRFFHFSQVVSDSFENQAFKKSGTTSI